MNAKIALGALGGIGLITTVSVVSSRSGSLDPNWEKEMPSFTFKFLSEDDTFMNSSQNNSSSRFGHRYAGLLVGDADISDDWWKWSYENLTKDLNRRNKPSEETFKSLNASSTVPNSVDSLKKWCSEIYKVDVGSENPSDNHDLIFNNASIWKYCSPVQQSPVSLQKSGANYSAGTIGNLKASSLLDTNKNERIWYYRNKLFEEKGEDSFQEGENRDVFLQGKKEGRKIQDICADIYKQNMREGSIHPDIKLFCSMSNLI